MLATVIMSFMVFTFTGLAVMNVSFLSSTTSVETVENIKLQYLAESTINEALWRINLGVDSLVNLVTPGTRCSWDETSQILSVNIENFNSESEICLDLSSDTHFNRSLASSSSIHTYGYSTDAEDEHQSRTFSFMPELDLQYFIDHADFIHHANDASWKSGALTAEGIHLFTGNNLAIENVTLDNSTFVFTGKGIIFSGINSLAASIPIDTLAALPALVFANPEYGFTLEAGTHIEGAIFCAGQIVLRGGSMSGPVIAQTIFLNHDVDFLDAEHGEYYRWTAGFKQKESYDWPKQLSRWRMNWWSKKIG